MAFQMVSWVGVNPKVSFVLSWIRFRFFSILVCLGISFFISDYFVELCSSFDMLVPSDLVLWGSSSGCHWRYLQLSP